MSTTQTNGFKSIVQEYGNQTLTTNLNGSDANINTINVNKITVETPISVGHQLLHYGNTEVYEYVGGFDIDASQASSTSYFYFYDTTSENNFFNPFKGLIENDDLHNYTVHLVELYAYGSGDDNSNYITTTFRYIVDNSFPASSSASGTRGCISKKYTLIHSDQDWRTNADTGKIGIKVEGSISTEGEPASYDYVYHIAYKLRLSKIR